MEPCAHGWQHHRLGREPLPATESGVRGRPGLRGVVHGDLSPIKLGLVFTGWGLLVAIFAVFGAPWLQERFGIIGVNNTITTQAVMTVSPVERPVASAAYSFVRFIGGGLAPYAAGRLVAAEGIHVPFFIAAGALVAGIAVLSTAHRLLGEAERVQAGQVTASAERPPAPALSPVTKGDTASGGRSGTGVIMATD
jgi:MFS transporter, ACDE family, multidrug resistance protein